MPKFLKILILLASISVLLIMVGVVYVSIALPNVAPAPENL
ncbi:hypothetical protein SAMN05192553_104213 [Cyclobacterium xiamenense]|uniref:Uncharacterized protein n=1 Tax=Cyclobacterium xiamenense TaxID=1297121 RepID=A0A1H6ZFK2_9BACT|nr:hypothetical protein SAMN05192553_104213 [Cyclobacterium xiamenense]